MSARSQLQSKPVADLREIADGLGLEHKGLQKAKDCCHSHMQNNYHFTIDFDLNIFQLKKFNNRLLTSLAFSI